MISLSVALWLPSIFYTHVVAQSPGSFATVGQTEVSAMMVSIFFYFE